MFVSGLGIVHLFGVVCNLGVLVFFAVASAVWASASVVCIFSWVVKSACLLSYRFLFQRSGWLCVFLGLFGTLVFDLFCF